MLVSTQQSISDLNEWKKYLSDLKNYFQTYGLNKEGVDNLSKEVNYNLSSTGIEINESKKQYLKNISDNLNSGQNYDSDSTQFKFVVNLITSINKDLKIKILQNKQDDLQQELTFLKQSMRPLARIFAPTRYRDYEDKKREFKNTVKNKWEAVIEKNQYELELIKEERSINFGDRIQKLENLQKDLEQDLNLLKGRDKKIMQSEEEYYSTKKKLKSQLHEARKEKWQTVLDQKFEESKNKQLDKVADEIDSSYIKRKIKNNNYTSNYVYKRPDNGGVRSLGEVLDRANPTYQDKKILLKWDIYQVKTLLEDETLTKGDRKALKEIYQDLKDELKKSKKDFDPKNEYIKRLKETRSDKPETTFQETLVQQEQGMSVSMP